MSLSLKLPCTYPVKKAGKCESSLPSNFIQQALIMVGIVELNESCRILIFWATIPTLLINYRLTVPLGLELLAKKFISWRCSLDEESIWQ
ncbi:MAG: hypothetical protein ACOC0N_02845 [Chroococcales cyanobacterium]